VYNDDYKDQYPKKRNTMATKARISASSKAARNSKHEGRTSSRKAIKSHTGHKLSHKRSQSLNKSNNGDQRYRSVPQNGYNNDIDNRKSYTKSKHDQMEIFNNRTPQVHLSKGKVKDGRLDLSLRNAKKNLQNYLIESKNPAEINKKNFVSMTGRKKGNPLRK
jgi:hypothetical protein